MERFLLRHQDRIAGSIPGFDRMRFQGTLRRMVHVDGMGKFLNSQGVLQKDFGGSTGYGYHSREALEIAQRNGAVKQAGMSSRDAHKEKSRQQYLVCLQEKEKAAAGRC
jgi:hypothetical protein